MKRLHVHVRVQDLDQSVGFYSTLFGEAPAVTRGDYVKWMLTDPAVNFAISARSDAAGIDHLGIQVESDGELKEIAGRLAAAAEPVAEQSQAACCYARSDKAWTRDPAGIVWETFHSLEQIETFGSDGAPEISEGCCGGAAAS
ncbi:MAG: ArsI/CadI family heavy metal resistance metalloenzyme [Alphaproteobacteria bacterium]|nr:ArsI/CadI family heavy metal resistance metalloenzyme [Alphaproteobacteria bacterium]